MTPRIISPITAVSTRYTIEAVARFEVLDQYDQTLTKRDRDRMSQLGGGGLLILFPEL